LKKSSPPQTAESIVNEDYKPADSSEIRQIKESAYKVITDIQNSEIFDDIKIDFENIIESVAPQDDQKVLNQMLVSYYEEIHDVIQKRLDECSDIIEEFYMVKINEYKESILMNSDEGKQTDIT
jgi:hypothetical protein